MATLSVCAGIPSPVTWSMPSSLSFLARRPFSSIMSSSDGSFPAFPASSSMLSWRSCSPAGCPPPLSPPAFSTPGGRVSPVSPSAGTCAAPGEKSPPMASRSEKSACPGVSLSVCFGRVGRSFSSRVRTGGLFFLLGGSSENDLKASAFPLTSSASSLCFSIFSRTVLVRDMAGLSLLFCVLCSIVRMRLSKTTGGFSS